MSPRAQKSNTTRSNTEKSRAEKSRPERPRSVAVVTGSRAEYGLLRPVITALVAHAQISPRLYVAGAHLVQRTDRDVVADGHPIAGRIRMQQRGAVGRAEDAAALGRGVTGFAKAFAADEPDFVLVLGDRIEALAAACAASVGGRRLVHLHGGDRAEGVADEAMRHAISKLAHLHLPATPASAERLIAMGEVPTTVKIVGSPAMDGLRGVRAAADAPTILVMHHPSGGSDAAEFKVMQHLLEATQNHDRMILAPNLDPGRAGVLKAIEASDAALQGHLPRDRFVSLLKGAKVLVGNSSAGLIEAAALGTAVVNVGDRQAGRERCANLIDAGPTRAAITAALARAMKLKVDPRAHPYGNGRTGPRVASLLARIALQRVPLSKQNTY